ncbi:hypothetical protein E6C27_scaffold128G001430 [Cucumis melo var. makuwa]|uniref:Uncharacterized protein n=1 Tax=Cucumis melo var. makuwa TaxID=1194695 RepID=A0A5A7TIF4_CUCMM|nr:hypothetical protein E6C27_scaffold128G001430 [Cucumis melo var. makuwa]
MSADQYAMDLRFTTVTRSKSRSSDIQIGSPTESSTPPRPSANLIRPSSGFVQMRPPASPSSNNESSTPPTTYSQAVTPNKRFPEIIINNSKFFSSSESSSSSIQEDEEQVDPEYDLDDPFLNSRPM